MYCNAGSGEVGDGGAALAVPLGESKLQDSSFRYSELPGSLLPFLYLELLAAEEETCMGRRTLFHCPPL